MRLFAVVAVITILLSSVALAENPACTAQIPAGTSFKARLSKGLKSDTAKVGDEVELVVTQDVRTPDKKVIIGHDTKLTAHVVDAAPFLKGEGDARLAVRVSGIVCKPEVRPFDAYLSGIPEVPTVKQTEIGMGGDDKSRKGDNSVPEAFGEAGARKIPNIEVKPAGDPKIGTVMLNKKNNIKLDSGVILPLRSL